MRVVVLRAAVAALILALGIGIGAGPLQEDQERRAQQLEAQEQKVAARDREISELRRSAQFNDSFTESTGGRLVRGSLTGRTVAVVQLPGADPATLAGLRSLVTAAGGQLTAEVPLAEPVAQVDQRQLVAALTSQMATQEDLVMPSGGSGYERFGALLARAVAVPSTGKNAGAPYDQTALGIVSGFQTAGLVRTTAAITRRASLTLVVTGAQVTEDGETDVYATLVRSYAEGTRVVVAGPSAAASAGGVLGRLRTGTDPGLLMSTVDSAELASGRVAAVLALAAVGRGTTGSYGAVDAADGAVPAVR